MEPDLEDYKQLTTDDEDVSDEDSIHSEDSVQAEEPKILLEVLSPGGARLVFLLVYACCAIAIVQYSLAARATKATATTLSGQNLDVISQDDSTVWLARFPALGDVQGNVALRVIYPNQTAVHDPNATAADDNATKDDDANGCALLFFELPKQFRSTVLPSIRTHILASNAACAVYVHTYNVSMITTHRNGEHAAPIFAAEVRAFTSNVIMDSMEAFPHDLAWFRRHNHIWQKAESMDNMVKQWHSIERVWGSMRAAEQRRGREYARVGLFRLDVVYKTDIRLDDGERAVIPDFGHWNNDPKRGLNDRMFYGDRAYGEQWAMGRFSQVEAYVASHANTLHSESFMLYLMRDVPITLKPICFWRVRANGHVNTGDCQPPKPPTR
jgi:hypothetical protein